MNIFTIAYNPPLNEKVVETLKLNYTPSMTDLDDYMGQYTIEQVLEVYKYLDIDYDDTFTELINANVDYIEI